MASVSVDQGDSLNVDLNLVPFIDLLSTLVLFLLVTAVWLQISAIPASVESKGKSIQVAPSPTNRPTVRVSNQGIDVNFPGDKRAALHLSRAAGKFDFERLAQSLMGFAQKAPSQEVVVMGDDGVEYRAVVSAIDAAKSAGLRPALATY